MKAKSGLVHRGHGSLDAGSLTPNGLDGNEIRREKNYSFFLFPLVTRAGAIFRPRLPPSSTENREIERVNRGGEWMSTLEV